MNRPFLDGLGPSEKDKNDMRDWLLDNVPSCKSLYKELAELNGEAVLVPHSRGNLVTSNALWILALTKGRRALSKFTVLALASPAPVWPPGIKRLEFFNYRLDPIVWTSSPYLLRGLKQLPESTVWKLYNGRTDQLTPDDWQKLDALPRSTTLLKTLRSYRPQAGEAVHNERGDYGIPIGHIIWNHCVLAYFRMPDFERTIHSIILPRPPYITDTP